MEFPPEIVAIIRAFYQPCFKYFREYKRSLKLCGPLPHLREKFKDHGFIQMFLEYEKALMEWNSIKSVHLRDVIELTDEKIKRFNTMMNTRNSFLYDSNVSRG